ncbi:Universal stress protein (Usp) [Pseudooceanicola batsensis HTCC2597]|uniref:Universal stress protein (Usp) n=1 Tax=Pseudooceanicola batsensis (strain ATCC BAA-863 / DSM 15984 / KCTC 12145 / HTCC2597) TaxID=252305 RepID=A3U2K9_PSEBH|nr:universal stress protein [Pseudooceanicola batsensis]EAQ01583.1 Universal stress protein (Usp) [Pseudooceanicola batsensis HTCC2597]
MFKKIMVPVDLAHADRLEKALACAGALASQFGAETIYVGVSAAAPSSVAHTPEEFAQKLSAFAKEQAQRHGITTGAHAMTSHDPATDLDPTLMKAVDETGADLVVMASHVPNIADYVWPSNGGTLASHAKASVLVVRDS